MMRQVRRQAMVPFSVKQMYALVDAVECYPQFLPWCTGSEVQSRSDTELEASLTIGYGSLHSTFSTRNELHAPASMVMHLLDGPFERLEGRWDFEALGSEGCEVRLNIEFEFSSRMQDMLFGPTFETICNELIDAFIRRANDLYGI